MLIGWAILDASVPDQSQLVVGRFFGGSDLHGRRANAALCTHNDGLLSASEEPGPSAAVTTADQIVKHTVGSR